MSPRQLRRVRWAVRACLVLGVAASVAANVLHAERNPIAQAIAAWPPLALLLTVELISRVPVHHRSLAVLRFVATFAIAGIAAWVSYWHMAGVAARYGESGAAPYLLPLSVDGLVVVASVSLVELAGRIRTVSDQDQMGRATSYPDATVPAPDPAAAVGPNVTAPVSAAAPPPPPLPVAALVEAKPLGATLREQLGDRLGERLSEGRPRSRTSPATGTRRSSTARVPSVPTPRRGRPVEETRRLAAELAAEHPDATPEELAEQLGITPTRLRRVLATTPSSDLGLPYTPERV